jgi:hypothetical protein
MKLRLVRVATSVAALTVLVAVTGAGHKWG